MKWESIFRVCFCLANSWFQQHNFSIVPLTDIVLHYVLQHTRCHLHKMNQSWLRLPLPQCLILTLLLTQEIMEKGLIRSVTISFTHFFHLDSLLVEIMKQIVLRSKPAEEEWHGLKKIILQKSDSFYLKRSFILSEWNKESSDSLQFIRLG